MAKRTREFDSDADRTPLAARPLSSNGQWIFGSVYAGLVLLGFIFGVVTGANNPKPVAVAELKKDDKPAPVVTPFAPKTPVVTPPVVEPKPKEPEPEPKPKEPEPTPEPKPKEPEPKPKEKEPEPKKVDVRAVSFKEVSVVFRQYCNNCHGAAGKPKAGVDLLTVAAILKGNENGKLVKPGDPENSPLYMSVKPPSGTMPPDGKPGPNEKELKLIYDWIAGGAKPRRTVRVRRRAV